MNINTNAGSSNNDGVMEATFTPYFYKLFKETFDCEIELLQGEIKHRPNGMVWFKITLAGYKLAMLDDFVRMLMALPTDQVKVTYKGVPIFPN